MVYKPRGFLGVFFLGKCRPFRTACRPSRLLSRNGDRAAGKSRPQRLPQGDPHDHTEFVAWTKLAKCSQDTAHRDILKLVDAGLLTQDPGGGRSTSYSLVSTDFTST